KKNKKVRIHSACTFAFADSKCDGGPASSALLRRRGDALEKCRVRWELPKLLHQHLHRLDRVERRQRPAEQSNFLENVRRQDTLLLARPRLGNIHGGKDAAVGELAV